jgi:CRP/FNR family transcriptional regulator
VNQHFEILKASTLLSHLDDKKLTVLAHASRLCTAARGEAIWSHGSQVDFFGVVQKGFVQMVRTSPNGIETTIEVVGPRQCFGLLGTVDHEGCPLRAEAMTDVSFLRVPKAHFLAVYEASPVMKDVLMKKTISRLRSAHGLLGLLAGGRVEQRIAAILLTLAKSYGEERKDGIWLSIPITRQELAQMSGTTVETTIRTMSRWQKEGIARTDDHHILLLDLDALERLVQV